MQNTAKYLKLALILTVTVQMMTSATPSARAQGLPPGYCRTDTYPIYIASTGRILRKGQVRMCALPDNGVSVTDVTPTPNAITPGEQLFLSEGRLAMEQPVAIFRARPNVGYVVRGVGSDTFAARGFVTRDGIKWSQVSRVLPFVPTSTYDQGIYGGLRYYTYGNLRFMSSRRAAAAPLNENSVIVSVAGFSLNSPDALAGLLYNPAPNKFIEVVYYQRGEQPVVFKRAFVPVYQRADVAGEWTALANQFPKGGPDYQAGAIVVGAILTTVTMAYLVKQLIDSPIGQQFQADYERCVRDPASLVC